MIYYLNGQFIESNYNTIDIRDRGFLLGDGVFTTLKAVSGKLISFDKHLKRINANAMQIKININLDADKISEICQILLFKNNLLDGDAVIRVTVTRGISERGINISKNIAPTLLISITPYQNTTLPFISLGTSSIVRYEKSITSQIKSLNYLDAILAREEAQNLGFNDAIFLNSLGHIVCTTVANIFFISKNGELITPPLMDGALSGIMRSDIIEDAPKRNLTIIESSIKLSNLDDYIGCFITNSVIGIQIVNKIDNRVFATDNVEIKKYY